MLYTPRNQTPSQQANNEYANHFTQKSSHQITTQGLLIQYIAILSDIEIPEELNEEEAHLYEENV